MISSSSQQVYSSYGQNNDINKTPNILRLKNNNLNCFQTSNSFYPKTQKHKKYSSNLFSLKFDARNINQLLLLNDNKPVNDAPIVQNLNKIFSQNENKSDGNYTERIYTSENVNILNLNTPGMIVENKNDYSNFDIKPTHGISGKIQKIPHIFLKKKFSDQNQLFNNNKNINFFNNFNSQLFYNAKNAKVYKNINSTLNKSANNLTNFIFNSPSHNKTFDNYNLFYSDEEPNNNFKLTDLIIEKEIGKGAEGVIYAIRWKKNNKKYAMKKCQIMFPINAKKRENDNAALKNFIDRTGCDGIIKPYATLCKPNEVGFTDCYEIMELADKDWETEIMNRGKLKKYYSEYELMDIFKYLIKTFALLQSNHITHRDIKPQNIMISNGKLKICDFGNARILKRNGIIIQRIRGSELFMSPIVFKGYRSGIQNIRHNAYKSDVYSLGICFFLAATLSYDGPNVIRLMNDMKKIKKALDYNLAKRYSQEMINMILTMLQVEESKRPDFLDLEILFP